MRLWTIFSLSIFLIQTAFIVIAPPTEAALVSCTTNCTFCDFFSTAQNVLNFMIFALALPLTGFFFLIGGFLIMVSGITAFTEWTGKAGTELHSLGVRAITGAVVGALIVLAAWVFINTLLSFIVNRGMFPWPWNEIRCQ